MHFEAEEPWQMLSASEKKQRLFEQQKQVLDRFLERGAISKAQYDRSYGDMKKKMFPDRENRYFDREE